MKTLEEALELVLANVLGTGVEVCSLVRSLGQVSTEDIYSTMSLPMADLAGPDGYAARSVDIETATSMAPCVLKILGISRAGCPAKKHVIPGTAIRIMTGSVVPEGADCVVRFEDTDEPADKNGPNPNNPSEVKIFKVVGPGGNIRGSGGIVKNGELLFSKGTLIGPHHISSLACIGVTTMKVLRRPKVAVIPTGDELVKLGGALSPGKIYDCNGPAIVSYVTQYGGIPKFLGIARDKKAYLQTKLDRALEADLIITSGGVSKGDYDLVRLVLGERGNILFSRVRMGPGAAVSFAMIERPSKEKTRSNMVPVLSLSGPPAGCLVNMETILRPALLKMRGLPQLQHPAVTATLVDEFTNNMPFSFAHWSQLEKKNGGYQVDVNISKTIGGLPAITRANALTIIPGNSALKSGDSIQVLPINGY
jgi:molybdopterin molybdotransferase